MILVTGATGHLGSQTIDFLLKKTAPANLAALVRNPEKAAALREKGVEIRIGNYDDYASLVKAFQGIDKLYFVSGSDIAARSAQQQNVVNAAKEAGVKHVVYTSFQRKTEDGTSPIAFVADVHLKTEQWLKASGIPYTIMKHGLYADMLPMFMGEKVIEQGLIYQPAGDGKAAFTLRKDMAEVGAVVLTSNGHENKEYNIVGNKAWSYTEIAELLTEITGKTIRYVSPSIEEFINTLTAVGVPEEYAGFFAAFAKSIEAGEFEDTSSDFERLVGRKPAQLPDFLRTVYA